MSVGCSVVIPSASAACRDGNGSPEAQRPCLPPQGTRAIGGPRQVELSAHAQQPQSGPCHP